MPWTLLVFCELRRDVVLCFVDIIGIVFLQLFKLSFHNTWVKGGIVMLWMDVLISICKRGVIEVVNLNAYLPDFFSPGKGPYGICFRSNYFCLIIYIYMFYFYFCCVVAHMLEPLQSVIYWQGTRRNSLHRRGRVVDMICLVQLVVVDFLISYKKIYK